MSDWLHTDLGQELPFELHCTSVVELGDGKQLRSPVVLRFKTADDRENFLKAEREALRP